VGVENPRQIAGRILRRFAEQKDYLENLLEEELDQIHLAPADRGLVHELTFGVVRWQATLDWLIARKTKGRAQKPLLQILLRLGLYQMFWLDRIPDHAAVHETVELAKRLGLGHQSGFINAILRGYLRERKAAENELQELKIRQPALGYSHPEWLVERWQNRWGEEKLRLLLEWNNTSPVTCARLNSLKTTPEELAAQWEKEAVRFTPKRWAWIDEDLVFELKSHPPLASLPSFQQGLFYIQDPSTLLAVQELGPQPGESVLDVCAAPGGKTTFMAQRMRNRGQIVAQDILPDRLRFVEQNCARLGVTCVEALLPSTIQTPPSRLFERILVDVPCSNTGVMRRRVDLRWRVRPEEIRRLSLIQLDLLQTAALRLKPAGKLVYSTCSLEPEENGEVIKQFLAGARDFQLVGERMLLPFVEGVDGAYVAAMVRAG
jgi:16S rRNA (cytosine967-C5)-methyltransferase